MDVSTYVTVSTLALSGVGMTPRGHLPREDVLHMIIGINSEAGITTVRA